MSKDTLSDNMALSKACESPSSDDSDAEEICDRPQCNCPTSQHGGNDDKPNNTNLEEVWLQH